MKQRKKRVPVGSEPAAVAATVAAAKAAWARELPPLLPARQFAVEPSRADVTADTTAAEQLRRKSQGVYRAFYEQDGPVQDLVNLYDHWIDDVLPDQVASKVLFFRNGDRITFEVVRTAQGRPAYEPPRLSSAVPLYPAEAIEKGLTYQFDVVVRVRAFDRHDEELTEGPVHFKLGSIPAMVGSRVCWTRNLAVGDPAVARKFHLSAAEAEAYRRAPDKPDPVILERMGLDRTDILSYFIIGGAQYVVLLNEKLRMNAVTTYWTKKDGRYVTSLKSSTNAGSIQTRVAHVVKERHKEDAIRVLEFLSTSALTKRQTIRSSGALDYVKGTGVVATESTAPSPKIPEYTNVYHIFRLYGLEGPDDGPFADYRAITEFILGFVDARYHNRARALLSSTIFDFRGLSFADVRGDLDMAFVEDGEDPALTFFTLKFSLGRDQGARGRLSEMKNILRAELLPHVNTSGSDEEDDWRRMLALGFMVGRHIMVELGGVPPEDRSSWANNFLFSAGKVLEVQFNWWWANAITAVQENIHAGKFASKMSVDEDAHVTAAALGSITAQLSHSDNLVNTFITAFKTKRWEGFDKTALSTTLAEPMRVETYGSVLSQVSVVNVKVNRRVRDIGLRMIQPSQAGYFCPAETPERDNCGLVKHRSIGCRLSREEPGARRQILALLGGAPGASRLLVARPDPAAGATTLLFLNGAVEGWCRGQEAVDRLRASRRSRGGVPKDTLLVYTRDAFLSRFAKPITFKEDVLYAYTDGGRPTRPLFVVEGGELVIDRLSRTSGEDYWQKPFRVLLDSGCVEYVDAWESDMACYIAPSPWHLADTRVRLEEARRAADAQRARLEELLQAVPAPDPDLALPQRELAQLRETELRISELTRGLAEARSPADIAGGQAEIARLQRESERLGAGPLAELRRRITTARAALKNAEALLDDLEHSRDFTHCEIHPVSLWGTAASATVLPDHTYAPRTTFAAMQQKQTIGIPHANYLNRFDKIKVLAYPTQPVFETMTDDLMNSAVHPAGMEVVVAELIYTGATQEDAIIVNRAAIERGLFTYVKYSDYTTSYTRGSGPVQLRNPSTVMMRANPRDADQRDRPLIPKRLCGAVNSDGLPILGKEVKEGDVLVGRVMVYPETGGEPKYTDMSLRLKATDAGRIYSYMLCQNASGEEIIKVRIAAVRVPIVGDKFTDRSGQKATISRIMPPEDMPFFPHSGVTPDIIVNPHAFSARMTVNKVMEILVGKAAALRGERYDATAFQGFSLQKFYDALRLHGFEAKGTEAGIAGSSGAPIRGNIFVGMSHYFSLKHNAMDKIQFRGTTGSFNAESKEPSGGVGKESGAARVSELERQAIIAHGASAILVDRLCDSSNRFTVAVCLNCNAPAVFSVGGYECRNCQAGATFGRISMKYSQHWLTSLLRGLMVDVRYRTRPLDEESFLELFRQVGFLEPQAATRALERRLRYPDPALQQKVAQLEAAGEPKDAQGAAAARALEREITAVDPDFPAKQAATRSYAGLRAVEQYHVVGVLLTRETQRTGVFEVLGRIVNYAGLVRPPNEAALHGAAAAQQGSDVITVLDNPRDTGESYFLAMWGPDPNSRVAAFREQLLIRAKRPATGAVMRTTNLETVFKEMSRGRLTNPEPS